METIWLTGASSGIGEALFKQLHQRGYRLIVTARNRDKLETIAAGCPRVAVLDADLTENEALQTLPQRLDQLGWGVDRLIVNAGGCEYMEAGRLDKAAVQRVFAINFFAAIGCVDIAIPFLRKSPTRGHIIAISSMSVYLPFQRAAYYGASKVALDYYLQSLALEWQDELDLSLVYPGFVKTPLTDKNDFPMPFIMSADQAAQAMMHVMDSRTARFSFPRRMHYLLKMIDAMPDWVWRMMNRKKRDDL